MLVSQVPYVSPNVPCSFLYPFPSALDLGFPLDSGFLLAELSLFNSVSYCSVFLTSFFPSLFVPFFISFIYLFPRAMVRTRERRGSSEQVWVCFPIEARYPRYSAAYEPPADYRGGTGPSPVWAPFSDLSTSGRRYLLWHRAANFFRMVVVVVDAVVTASAPDWMTLSWSFRWEAQLPEIWTLFPSLAHSSPEGDPS